MAMDSSAQLYVSFDFIFSEKNFIEKYALPLNLSGT